MKTIHSLVNYNRLLLMAAATCLVAASSSSVALADQSAGVINMSVTDTSNGSMQNTAQTVDSAQPVYPGDTLVFQILVTNHATDASDQMSDAAVTDSLPAGLTMVSEDNMNLGTVNPFSSASVTVTATVDSGASGILKNQACFTASTQTGCDSSMVNVLTPTAASIANHAASAQPAASADPSATGAGAGSSATEPAPTTTPDTGGSLTGSALGVTGIATAATAYMRSRKRK